MRALFRKRNYRAHNTGWAHSNWKGHTTIRLVAGTPCESSTFFCTKWFPSVAETVRSFTMKSCQVATQAALACVTRMSAGGRRKAAGGGEAAGGQGRRGGRRLAGERQKCQIRRKTVGKMLTAAAFFFLSSSAFTCSASYLRFWISNSFCFRLTGAHNDRQAGR